MAKLEIICRPLESWPRAIKTIRKSNPFRTSFEVTRRRLSHELRHLGVSTAVVQVAVAEGEISTVSGWPHATVRPAHPGVIVAADTRHGALKWPCDSCTKWTDNVHAIALTLKRLRLADLYEVSGRGEQYAGWKMLPGPITAAGGPTLSLDDAARWAAKRSGVATAELIGSRAKWEAAKRSLVKLVHPDTPGGQSSDEWPMFQDVSKLLDGLHSRR